MGRLGPEAGYKVIDLEAAKLALVRRIPRKIPRGASRLFTDICRVSSTDCSFIEPTVHWKAPEARSHLFISPKVQLELPTQ